MSSHTHHEMHTATAPARVRDCGPGHQCHSPLPHRPCHRRGPRHGAGHLGGWSDGATIALAIVLAFVFGYSLTIAPVLRAGLPLRAALGVVLAADTVSITIMEIVDNLGMLLIPGAIEAGLTRWLFWGALAASLAIAFVITVPVNKALIARGMGHAVVHAYH